ncbi:MAG: DUF6427 family protein [Bacteroidota bacterium]
MVFLFRDKSIINIFFLVLLSIAVHTHLFMSTPILLVDKSDGVLSILLATYLTNVSPTLLFITYQLIILLQSIRLNMVLTDFRMFQSTNYATAMTYILFTGIISQWCSISAALISNSLVLWIFILLSRLYNNQTPRTLLFNIGMLVSLTIIAYHPTAILIMVILFALAVVRPFRIAEWILLLMGVLLPYYFLAAYLFLTDQLATIKQYIPFIQFHFPVIHPDQWLWISLGYLFFALIIGMLYWQKFINRMVIQIRKNWSVMLVLLLILVIAPFIFTGAGMDTAILCLIPIAAFVANAFGYPRRLLVPNLLFWLAILLVVHNNWELIKK